MFVVVYFSAISQQVYWIVDPETRQVTLCQWVSGQYEDQVYSGEEILQSIVVPGFGLTTAAIFA